MQIKLNDVSNMAIPRSPEEEESMEEKAMNGLEIMRVTDQTGYLSLRNILIEKKIYDKKSLPSCYQVFQHLRPQVDEFEVQQESIFILERRSPPTRKRKSEVLKGENEDCRQNSLKNSYYIKKLRTDSKSNEPNSTTNHQSNNNPVIAAKICGTYETYMDILRANSIGSCKVLMKIGTKKVGLY